jgi:hypothetical protein
MRRRMLMTRFGLFLAVALLLIAGPVQAQMATATIAGVVSDDSGVLSGASVTAVNTQSGFRHEAVAGPEGRYQISGLHPGTYYIRVSSPGYQEQSRTVQVLVGQTLTVDFLLTVDALFTENITVVGESTQLLIDTRSAEVSTNITPQQMESLPVNNRNFLAYAALAPGVSFTVDNDAEGQTFSSGAQKSAQVNVFIDGVSFKNDLIKAGAFMQDSSRGNPFPQSAVQEYQVITQNYKAEYDKAAAAVITAVTKSGGNDFTGEVFHFFQDEGMVAQDDFARAQRDEGAL